MTDVGVAAATGAIGPTGFSLLVWGSILLVILVFGYLVWVLSTERTRRSKKGK